MAADSSANAHQELPPNEAGGLLPALPVTIRNLDPIIAHLIRVASPRMASDAEQIMNQKLDDFAYELWTEDRRLGTD